jgi:hypothetical protein
VTLYALNALAFAVCLVALPWCAMVLTRAAIDGHRRGLARVQRGTSWTPKVTSRHDEQAAA